jgi:hypothetical protein
MTENKSLNEAELEAIRKRAEAATQGESPEWYVDEDYKDTVRCAWSADLMAQSIPTEADAEFIAHARQDVPKLLAEIERLNAQLSELIGAIYEYEPEGTALWDLAEAIDNDEN